MFLLISLLAWTVKDRMKKYMPLTIVGLLVTCFVANSTVLLPSSSLITVIEYSFILNPICAILAGAIGASAGELTGYMVGVEGGSLTKRFGFAQLPQRIRKHGFLWVMLFALAPLPVFDIAGILAGSIRMHPMKFCTACFIGKFLKMCGYVAVFHSLANLIG